MYYDYSKILSYNAILNMLFGERGVGKTFGATKFVAKRFIEKHKQFAYIRRFSTEFEDDTIPNFFSDIKTLDEFKNHEFSTKGHKFYIDGEIARLCNDINKGSKFKR